MASKYFVYAEESVTRELTANLSTEKTLLKVSIVLVPYTSLHLFKAVNPYITFSSFFGTIIFICAVSMIIT
jgi:hypothetical protein